VFGILGLLTLKYWVGYFIEEAKIRRNGGHAKVQLTSWVPLGPFSFTRAVALFVRASSDTCSRP
jgi:hypothetical protein